MTTPDFTTSLRDDAWLLHRRWAAVAESMHRIVERRRTLNLWLLIVGAISGAASALAHQHEWTTWAKFLGICAGATLSGAALAQQRMLGSRAVDRWVVARSCSERLKAAVYLSAGLRSAGAGDETSMISAAMDAAMSTGADFALDLHDSAGDNRPPPGIHSFDKYVSTRAAGQVAWHREAITRLRTRSTRYRRLEATATVAGGILSLVAALVADTAVAVGVGACTTIAGTCAAHLSAARYGRIATSYAVTCAALDRAITNLVSADQSQGRAEREQVFVRNVESILEEQNRTWLLLSGTD